MSDAPIPSDTQLQAEIEALRPRSAGTQDLYREVCVLLFFRHGITPTANRLYQLVRKGSMSAPTEALNRFWETLRDKSRIRIEHPDLPVELRDAAGEVVGTLWQRARTLAEGTLETARTEALASATASQVAADAARAQSAVNTEALAIIRTDLANCNLRLQESAQALAREQGVRAALDMQLGEVGRQRDALQNAQEAARQTFEGQLEKQRAEARAADDGHRLDFKRVLLDIDHERTVVANLQKTLDTMRRDSSQQTEKHSDHATKLQAELGHLRQQLGEVRGALTETNASRDSLRRQLEKALAIRETSKPRLTRKSLLARRKL